MTAAANGIGEWTAQAACRGADPEIFWPEPGQSADAALAICATCPVRTPCLLACTSEPSDPGGVWGGTTANDRRLKQWNRQADICTVNGCTNRPRARSLCPKHYEAQRREVIRLDDRRTA